MSDIRGVILDWGGVLAPPPSEEAFARLQQVSGLDTDAFAAAWLRHRLAYDVGEISAGEYWASVGAEAGRDYDESTLALLCAEDAACWSLPDVTMVAWLEELKRAGLRVALLSNVPREQWAALQDGLAWVGFCDVVALSYELRVGKPDPATYRHCLDRLALAPDEVVFVDDRPENVSAACDLGIHGIRFTTVDDLRHELSARFGGALPLP